MSARTRILLAVPLLVAVLASVFVTARLLSPSRAYALVDDTTLLVLKGTVEVQRSGGPFTRVADSAPLRVGDRARTGAASYATITYFDGSTTTLDPETEIEVRRLERLPTGGQYITFYQEIGVTWNRVERLIDANSRFETTTPSATAYVRGTEYRVAVDPRGRVTVESVTDPVIVETVVEGIVTAVVVEPGFQTFVEPGQPPSPPEPAPPSRLGLRVQVEGPVTMFLTDDRNRSVGFHPQAAAYVSQIPGAKYAAEAGRQTLLVPDPADGYDLVVRGEADGGTFDLTLEALVEGRPVSVRSVGLARSLAAEQIRSAIRPGQLVGTKFAFREGTISDVRRPLETLSSPPAASRVAFAAAPYAEKQLAMAPAVLEAAEVLVAVCSPTGRSQQPFERVPVAREAVPSRLAQGAVLPTNGLCPGAMASVPTGAAAQAATSSNGPGAASQSPTTAGPSAPASAVTLVTSTPTVVASLTASATPTVRTVTATPMPTQLIVSGAAAAGLSPTATRIATPTIVVQVVDVPPAAPTTTPTADLPVSTATVTPTGIPTATPSSTRTESPTPRPTDAAVPTPASLELPIVALTPSATTTLTRSPLTATSTRGTVATGTPGETPSVVGTQGTASPSATGGTPAPTSTGSGTAPAGATVATAQAPATTTPTRTHTPTIFVWRPSGAGPVLTSTAIVEATLTQAVVVQTPATPTPAVSPTSVASVTPSPFPATPSPTISPTPTTFASPTASVSPTAFFSPTATAQASPTFTATPCVGCPTATPLPTLTPCPSCPTATPPPTATPCLACPTETAGPTSTQAPTVTGTPTPTPCVGCGTATVTPTGPPTPTQELRPTPTATAPASATPTPTPAITDTPTGPPTPCVSCPTSTPTPTGTPCPACVTPTPLPTSTPTPTIALTPPVCSSCATQIAVGFSPIGIGVNHVTNRVYVMNQNGGDMSVVDGATNVVLGAVDLLVIHPDFNAVNTNTNQIFAAGTDVSDGFLRIVSGETNTITVSVALPPGGGCRYRVAVNEVTNRVYVSNACSETLTVVDGGTGQVVASLTVSGASGMAVNAATNRVYIARFDSIVILDGATHQVAGTIPLSFSPRELALNTTTGRLYATVVASPGLHVIDTQTNTLIASIPGLAAETGVAVNPTLNRVYTRATNTRIAVIDGATNAVVRLVDVPGSETLLAGIGANRVTHRVYASDVNSVFMYVFDDGAGSATFVASSLARPTGSPTPTITPSPTRIAIAEAKARPG